MTNIGLSHRWNYRNTNNFSRGRNIKIYQVKTRSGYTASRGQGYPVGGKLHWYIRGKQKVTKLRNGKYKITIQGTKTQAGIKPTKKGNWLNSKRY